MEQSHWQLGAVGMGSVVDSDDDDGVVGVVDAQQDPVIAAAGAVQADEVVAQWLAEPARVAGEGSGDEFDDGVDDPRWEALEVAAGWGGDFDPVRVGRGRRLVAHFGGMPCSARRSLMDTVSPAAYSASAVATSSRTPARESQ